LVYRFSVDQDTALPLKALAAVYCHYYIVKVEEPYLTLVFGEEVLYRLRTPRYFEIPRKADSGIHTKILK